VRLTHLRDEALTASHFGGLRASFSESSTKTRTYQEHFKDDRLLVNKFGLLGQMWICGWGIAGVLSMLGGPLGTDRRMEQQGELVQRVHIIFAFLADIAFPGGEIGQGDHTSARESEIGQFNRMHLADAAAAARNGLSGSLVTSHNM